jgi:hypothetical protein
MWLFKFVIVFHIFLANIYLFIMFDQSNYGHNERILPRPLPASYTDSDQVKNDEKDQEENEDAANDEVHPSSPLDSLFLHANPQIYCTCKIEHLKISKSSFFILLISSVTHFDFIFNVFPTICPITGQNILCCHLCQSLTVYTVLAKIGFLWWLGKRNYSAFDIQQGYSGTILLSNPW